MAGDEIACPQAALNFVAELQAVPVTRRVFAVLAFSVPVANLPDYLCIQTTKRTAQSARLDAFPVGDVNTDAHG